MFELNRPYTSVEILARENSALAVGQGVVTLKAYLENLSDQPAVWRDVLARCKDEKHLSLMQWIEEYMPPATGRDRFPKAHSPKHNLSVWMLYRAADLKCPHEPPKKRL